MNIILVWMAGFGVLFTFTPPNGFILGIPLLIFCFKIAVAEDLW
jgi:hypothetical protein